MTLHVQNVASVPELVDSLGQSTHWLLLTYWVPAVHDAGAGAGVRAFPARVRALPGAAVVAGAA